MFQITIDTAQTLRDHISYLHKMVLDKEENHEELRYNHEHLACQRCIQILDKLIRGYVGLKRFSEDDIKITLTDEFMERFNYIEKLL